MIRYRATREFPKEEMYGLTSQLKDMDVLCPAHCSQYQAEIKMLFPDKTRDGGVGRVIEFTD